jgi:hypothetical protein
MTSPRSHAEIQLEANLAAVRDLVEQRVVAFADDGDPVGRFDNDNVEMEHDPDTDSYTVRLKDEETYGDQDDEKTGSTSMTLVFNSSLVINKAEISVLGERGGGFDRPVGERSLGGFVANILVQLQNELTS